ncbi:tRNA U-34 5-methylaminomethyl-2-thiouridine biosynthesis protein [Pseudomonas entomophila]|uniref:DODA-type extradiol aromatic ring-opening family dioxygenase n=1 Tax=Pseudomonas entomophila TaxID=312306 RepID=UPI0023D7BE71|nr:tRNA U-34 5-methylaminomethyl-2-thiouridine biosynthesis protein [Pseudomonas entomophila]MDF0730093.1 tRNA U-34 5-methylaminomethyl-2-thiouridine biosynthesis protein [Pseudomonas entomophila]
MTLVSAFLVPGSPLPQLCPDVPNWQRFQHALQQAGAALKASQPDVVLIYSTQWFAVLDEIWLTRRRSEDIHVDENWHEFGELPYDLYSDVALANACIDACRAQGVQARGADYQGFPIDTGTIVASTALGVGGEALPLVVASNNLYDDAAATEKLAAIAVACAAEQGKRVAVVGVGGLSGSLFTKPIEPGDDRIVHAEEDAWNRKVLALIEAGDVAALREVLPAYAAEARVDMGFKHFHWLLGALGGRFQGARVHHYGALYGSGGAVVEFTP